MKPLIFAVLVLFGAVAHSLTLNVSDDTSSALNASADVDDASLTVRGRSTASNATGSYLSFSLANVPSSLEGQDIEKAVLRLWLEEVSRAGSLSLEVIESEWSESDAEYGSLPITSYSKKIRIKTSQKKNFIYVDLTELVRIWIDSPASNFGVALLPDKSRFSGTFSSKESSFGQSAQIEVALSATRGPRGLQGAKGARGAKGAKGATGATGAQGIQGLKGDTGDQGIQGVQGPQGEAADNSLIEQLSAQISSLQAEIESARTYGDELCTPRDGSLENEFTSREPCLNYDDLTGLTGLDEVALGLEGGGAIGSNFSGLTINDSSFYLPLQGADFSNTTVIGTSFDGDSGVNVRAVNFEGARFCVVNFRRAVVAEANFKSVSSVDGCATDYPSQEVIQFYETYLHDSDLSDISISGEVGIEGATLVRTNLTGASVSEWSGTAYFEDVTCPDGSTSQTGRMTMVEACRL